jgi:hypothetical protein
MRIRSAQGGPSGMRHRLSAGLRKRRRTIEAANARAAVFALADFIGIFWRSGNPREVAGAGEIRA